MSTVWTNLKKKEAEGTTAEYAEAVENKLDAWVPACGGHEEPTFGFLYVFNPATVEHGWLDLSTDIVQFTSPYLNN